MAVDVAYETHALTEDNENGVATGWWRRVLVIGHLATYRGPEHVVHGTGVRELVAADFTWRETGRECRVPA